MTFEDATAKATADPPAPPQGSPAQERFRSCRWRKAERDQPEYCTHRDVLPLAGTTGFNPESWCPDCAFYKLRRTVTRRPEY